MTGKQPEGAPDTIAEDDGTGGPRDIHQKQKRKGQRRKVLRRVPEMTDEELIERQVLRGRRSPLCLRATGKGALQSQSEADMAFCRKLAFWSGRTRSRWSIFRSSGFTARSG